MRQKQTELAKIPNAGGIIIEDDRQRLYDQLSALIEHSRRSMYVQINNATVLHFWEVGRHINVDILENKHADYGKKIVAQVATRLTEKYGRNYVVRNLRRMIQFAEQFLDFEIVSTASTQLSWSHFIEILPLKTAEAKIYYLRESSRSLLGVRELRKMIGRKAYERNEIADSQISTNSPIPFGTFKDPYLLDELEMKSEFQEADLEDAILRKLEKFILEFGKGFAFVDRQNM